MRLRRGRRGPYVSRAELVLARADTDPLAELGLKPDPLQAFALALGRVRDDLGEDAAVVIDVMPASAGQQRRLRRRLDNRAQREGKRRQQSNGPGVFDAMLDEGARSTRATSAQTVHQRSDVRHLWTKIGEDQPLFRVQILIRAESEIKGRAEAHVKALETCFRQFAGKNHWRVAGWRIPGVVFFGADSWWRRYYFDRRFETAIFRPTKRSVVNAGEIGGLLKPPTAHCKAPGVVRAGAAVAAPPRDLPAYRYRPGVLPLGQVMRDDQLVTVGMDIDEFFFGGLFGRSRFGKTELALVQFVHAAVIERAGALFFDPHQDAIARVKPYLSDVADRVIEINLARRGMDSTHVAWNLLSMEGLGRERLAERAAAVIDSFAVGAGWSGRSAGRTMAILSNAVYSLLYLALRLPSELQPTIFTLPRFLIDEDWREAAVRYLPEHLQRYWLTTYASYPGDAAGPLCQLISRLQTNPVVAATFGSPRSTYNPRRAMDQRSIILMCPPSGKEHLVTNLLMQGHIDAARSRADLPPDQRSLAYWWMDEAPAFDRATENAGTSSLAEVLEQCAKYGIRAMPMSQSPHRLSDSTIEALTTNASLLITTATSPKGARFFGDQWEAMDAKRAVQQLERFHYIGQPTHHGRRVEPFRIAGISMDTFWGERKHPERIAQLEASIDETCRPMTVAATLDLIDGHDERILQHIVGGTPRTPSASTAPPAPSSDRAVPIGDDSESPPVARPAADLLGGVTIKRRRRGAGSEPSPAAPGPEVEREPERTDPEPALAPAPAPARLPVAPGAPRQGAPALDQANAKKTIVPLMHAPLGDDDD